jgi:hypothetical protein
MKKTYREIKQALPNLQSNKVEEIADELDKILEIKALFQSEGGKQLITLLRNNCSVALRKSIVAAKNADKELLMASILDYSSNMDLLSTVQDISIEEELRKQLDEAVIEAGV